jgi:hypothetical protein
VLTGQRDQYQAEENKKRADGESQIAQHNSSISQDVKDGYAVKPRNPPYAVH